MTAYLSVETKKSLDALLPSISLTDGDLHATTSIPPWVYETPAHLQYVCERLAETRPPAELATRKFQCLQSINRSVKFKILPLNRLRRFKGWGGPDSTMMWSLKHVDPNERMSAPFLPWATTGDEDSIHQQTYKTVVEAIGKTPPMHYWRGCNSTSMSGRIFPIPQTQRELDDMLRRLELNLATVGITLIVEIKT